MHGGGVEIKSLTGFSEKQRQSTVVNTARERNRRSVSRPSAPTYGAPFAIVIFFVYSFEEVDSTFQSLQLDECTQDMQEEKDDSFGYKAR